MVPSHAHDFVLPVRVSTGGSPTALAARHCDSRVRVSLSTRPARPVTVRCGPFALPTPGSDSRSTVPSIGGVAELAHPSSGSVAPESSEGRYPLGTFARIVQHRHRFVFKDRRNRTKSIGGNTKNLKIQRCRKPLSDSDLTPAFFIRKSLGKTQQIYFFDRIGPVSVGFRRAGKAPATNSSYRDAPICRTHRRWRSWTIGPDVPSFEMVCR